MPNELSGVLWAYMTTPFIAIDESPFSLVYRVDAIIPSNIRMPNLRTELAWFDEAVNDQMMTENLDLLEKKKNKALIYLAYYH